MTPKEKARELYNRFYDPYLTMTDKQNARRCALIAVDEVTTYLQDILVPNPFGQYWQEVRKEIENL